MTDEQHEEMCNDLIAVIWPMLDAGMTRGEVESNVNNVLDAWTPQTVEG